jgi:actin-related protein
MPRGVVENWDEMERLWKHAYDQLGGDSTHTPAFVTQPVGEIIQVGRPDKGTTEKLAKVFFEEFNVPSLHICEQPELALLSAGMIEGLLVDCGHDSTRIMTVTQGGMTLTYTMSDVGLAGGAISQLLGDHLKGILRPYYFQSKTVTQDLVRDVKEKLCYVAQKFQKELADPGTGEKRYELPDGNSIAIGKDAFRLPEILFDPSLVSPGWAGRPGIPQAVCDSIAATDEDMRLGLFAKIIPVSCYRASFKCHFHCGSCLCMDRLAARA